MVRDARRRAPHHEGRAGCDKIRHDGQITSDCQKSCQAPESKIFRFTILEIRIITSPIPAHTRGVSRSSRCVGPECGGRFGVRRFLTPDENAKAYGEVVWSWRRDAGVKLVESSASDGGKQARSPGRARSKP